MFLSRGIRFSGVIYGHRMRVSIGVFVENLTIVAFTSDASEWVNLITHLPL